MEMYLIIPIFVIWGIIDLQVWDYFITCYWKILSFFQVQFQFSFIKKDSYHGLEAKLPEAWTL